MPGPIENTGMRHGFVGVNEDLSDETAIYDTGDVMKPGPLASAQERLKEEGTLSAAADVFSMLLEREDAEAGQGGKGPQVDL